MDALIYLAEAWWPLYAVHFVEVSLFILLVWAVDRWMTLDTRLRYVLYLLALAKVFVPPFYAIPLPEFLTVSDDVPIGPVYTGVVSEAEVVAPVQVAPLPLAFYLFCLWAVSVVVWAGVTLWKNAVFHRALSLAVPVDLARDMGSRSLNGARDMEVYAKASLRSPLLVGIVKPRLYLPSHWSSWSSEELRGVVAHELAHRDNRDIWVLIFQAIAMALFCINPLVWLLNRRLTFLRELRCDEAVLRETNLTPAEYGRLLFGFVDRRPALSALYFNERGTALKKRLEYVLNFKEDNVKRSRWQLAIPILTGLAIVPFSIREAYTHDEGGLEVIELVEDEKKPELMPGQQTTPPISSDADSKRSLLEGVETKSFLKQLMALNEKAVKEREKFIVNFTFMVNLDGSVSDVSILKGPEIFHQTVIDSVSQWRFKPGQHNGKVSMSVTFSGRGDRDSGTRDKQQFKVALDSTEQQTIPPASGDADSSEVKVFEYKEVEVKPHPINIITPVYPEKARKERIEGKVILKVVVNVDGSVSDVKVLEGPEIFRQAAIDAISQSQFKPAAHNGKSVPVWVVMPIEFSLGSTDTDLQLTSPVPIDADGNEVDIPNFFEVEAKPELLQSVKSVYPTRVTVRLEFRVYEDGSVGDMKVLKGPEEFHQAAIDAILQYRFKPGTLNGKVVPVRMTQWVIFRLPKQQTQPPASGDADSSKVLEFYMVEVKPKVLHAVKPVHPKEALRDSLEGKVFLKFMVNLDGSVSDVRVLRGTEVFRQAAIDAVSQFRFKPAEHNGKPVAVWMTQPVSFRLPKE
ncbi:MAG: M56 family metallopeptidase [Gemmatimonadetes bacterium]|nr:M56 family metallopeptidase [Gemmatimonadota bacterium]